MFCIKRGGQGGWRLCSFQHVKRKKERRDLYLVRKAVVMIVSLHFGFLTVLDDGRKSLFCCHIFSSFFEARCIISKLSNTFQNTAIQGVNSMSKIRMHIGKDCVSMSWSEVRLDLLSC